MSSLARQYKSVFKGEVRRIYEEKNQQIKSRFLELLQNSRIRKARFSQSLFARFKGFKGFKLKFKNVVEELDGLSLAAVNEVETFRELLPLGRRYLAKEKGTPFRCF